LILSAPAWAAPLSENRELVSKEERKEIQQGDEQVIAPVAPMVQEKAPAMRPRRVAVSSYIS
jgi:hypothetical protein